MKKILSSALVLAVLCLGCLKDKNLDEGNGLQIVESPAVAFPQAKAEIVSNALVSQTTVQTVDGPTVAFEASSKANSDIHITLALDNSIVTAQGLEVMPTSAYTLPGLTVTIPAGQQFGKFNITIPNSSLLDPTKTYGIGFTIAGVDNGLRIASNQRYIIFAFSIKNKYDGVYALKAFVNMGTTNTTPPYLVNVPCGNALEIEMSTISASKVEMSHQPVFRGGSIIYFSGLFPIEISFHPNTDQVINVKNIGASSGTYPYVFPDATDPSYNSRYDPSTKTIYEVQDKYQWYLVGSGYADMVQVEMKFLNEKINKEAIRFG